MTRLKFAVLALALLVLAPAAASAQAGITGAWEVTMETPQGANTVDVNFKQDGQAITGELISPMGTAAFKGTLVNDALTINAPIAIQGNSLELLFTAKVTGDTMSGNVKFGDFGEAPWTGKRKAGGAAAATASAAPAAAAAAAPAVASAAGGAGAGDANGKWDIKLHIGGAGEFPLSALLKQEGEKVTGTFSSQAGDVPVSGTMTGRALKLQFVAQTPNGDLPITMTGDLGADGFTGKASLAGMGEAEWTGTRAKQ